MFGAGQSTYITAFSMGLVLYLQLQYRPEPVELLNAAPILNNWSVGLEYTYYNTVSLFHASINMILSGSLRHKSFIN